MSWTAIVKAVIVLLGAIRDFFHAKENADSRQAGRDEANASTQKQNAERVNEAMQAEVEIDRKRQTSPGDVDADDGFRRD